MANKGAQAMTLVAMDILKKKYPDDQIIILATNNTEEFLDAKLNCRAQIATYKMLKKLSRQFRKTNRTESSELSTIFSMARVLVDISGYALSSNWSDGIVNRYIEVLNCARLFSIPVYLLPQSFGPINYTFPKSIYMNNRIKKALEYAHKIYAREKEGYEELTKKFGLTNVVLAKDMVLCANSIDIKNLFDGKINRCYFSIGENAVGIVPNSRLLTVCDEKQLMKIYVGIINYLQDNKNNIYIVCHSSEDKRLAKGIVMACKAQNLHIIDNDMYCFDYEELFQQFNYIIASRYHSIIHALKKGTPCIAIGWADKYTEVLHDFQQDDYIVDMRNNISLEEILVKIISLQNKYSLERKIILEKIKSIVNPDYLI